ncbi:hypothetical protein K458DRAFT_389493 [Lentithecium fluviatile CBS 122367]|uniref:Uncharacterized protein n=1 Tax=Lentithecium fluviatile CBS 122367 TaxID=1168545 RepID=A0A6G1J058_9PLEO|nr:hypothetical protein K458DRAFT_389493 [Lentithecium fluviatile CBS 122367]
MAGNEDKIGRGVSSTPWSVDRQWGHVFVHGRCVACHLLSDRCLSTPSVEQSDAYYKLVGEVVGRSGARQRVACRQIERFNCAGNVRVDVLQPILPAQASADARSAARVEEVSRSTLAISTEGHGCPRPSFKLKCSLSLNLGLGGPAWANLTSTPVPLVPAWLPYLAVAHLQRHRFRLNLLWTPAGSTSPTGPRFVFPRRASYLASLPALLARQCVWEWKHGIIPTRRNASSCECSPTPAVTRTRRQNGGRSDGCRGTQHGAASSPRAAGSRADESHADDQFYLQQLTMRRCGRLQWHLASAGLRKAAEASQWSQRSQRSQWARWSQYSVGRSWPVPLLAMRHEDMTAAIRSAEPFAVRSRRLRRLDWRDWRAERDAAVDAVDAVDAAKGGQAAYFWVHLILDPRACLWCLPALAIAGASRISTPAAGASLIGLPQTVTLSLNSIIHPPIHSPIHSLRARPNAAVDALAAATARVGADWQPSGHETSRFTPPRWRAGCPSEGSERRRLLRTPKRLRIPEQTGRQGRHARRALRPSTCSKADGQSAPGLGQHFVPVVGEQEQQRRVRSGHRVSVLMPTANR